MIDHTPALLVIDQRGREQKIYLTELAYASVAQSAQILAEEVASLLPGHPRLADSASLAHIRLGLAADVPARSSPACPSGSVTLGPGAPACVLFFATWVQRDLRSRAQLTALNAYRAGSPARRAARSWSRSTRPRRSRPPARPRAYLRATWAAR